jgi:hypothetical protein
MQLSADRSCAGCRSLRRWHAQPQPQLLSPAVPHARPTTCSRRTATVGRSSWDEEAQPGGDGDTQDGLVDLLRAEIQKENFKEEIREDVKEKQAQLRKMGEEVRCASGPKTVPQRLIARYGMASRLLDCKLLPALLHRTAASTSC